MLMLLICQQHDADASALLLRADYLITYAERA